MEWYKGIGERTVIVAIVLILSATVIALYVELSAIEKYVSPPACGRYDYCPEDSK